MSPQTTFEISETRRDAESVSLQIKGDLTVETSPQLKRMLNACFDQKLKRIHILLDGVAKMDSSGIATLVDGLRWSRTSGNHFSLSGLTDAVHDLFVIAKLENEFEIVAEDHA
ncbi:MAG TPA: STAS domain-containing protein [Mariprofundaceae bacterium]|nr:STAS domain-containing protein [Mariprofundaceae bacterium]